VRKAGDEGGWVLKARKVGSGGWWKLVTPRKAAPRWVGALGHAEEERGRLVRSGDSEPVMEIGAEAAASFYSCMGGGWMGWTGRLSLGS
jgi:hypothetical protein